MLMLLKLLLTTRLSLLLRLALSWRDTWRCSPKLLLLVLHLHLHLLLVLCVHLLDLLWSQLSLLLHLLWGNTRR